MWFTTIVGQPGGAGIAAWVAHLFAWGVGLWLAFGPVYQGTTATPVQVDPASGQVIGSESAEVTSHTLSLIEVNGPQAGLLLLAPVALTGLSVLAARFTVAPFFIRKSLQGAAAVVLLGGCILAMFSIGIFYVPSALALCVSACLPLPERTNVGEEWT